MTLSIDNLIDVATNKKSFKDFGIQTPEQEKSQYDANARIVNSLLNVLPIGVDHKTYADLVRTRKSNKKIFDVIMKTINIVIEYMSNNDVRLNKMKNWLISDISFVTFSNTPGKYNMKNMEDWVQDSEFSDFYYVVPQPSLDSYDAVVFISIEMQNKKTYRTCPTFYIAHCLQKGKYKTKVYIS